MSIDYKRYHFEIKGKKRKISIVKTKLKDKLEPGEVIVKNQYAYLSHFDYHILKGDYVNNMYPGMLGISACGIVDQVGEGVDADKIGKRVAYCTKTIGSYAEYTSVPNQSLIFLPDDINSEICCGLLVPGLVAHFLVTTVFDCNNQTTALVNGASGSIAHILIQMLYFVNVHVVALVGSKEKEQFIQKFSPNHIFLNDEKNLAQEIKNLSNGQGANVIYDCRGKKALDFNLDVASLFCCVVNYGDTTGMVEYLPTASVMQKGLTYCRPNINLYKYNRVDLVKSSEMLFNMYRQGHLKPEITIHSFKEISKVLQMRKKGELMGSHIAKIQ